MMQHPFMAEVTKRLSADRAAELVPSMVQLLESEYRGEDGRIGHDCVAIVGSALKPAA
jgi:hypothetical protein